MSSIQSSVTNPDSKEDYGESVFPVANRIKQSDDGSIHVLHVDDDSNLLDLASTFLERIDESFDVSTVTHAQDALDKYHRHEDDIECIVSDYQMPEMDGLDFLKAVRDEYPDVPFILFTGKGSEEVASDAIAAGVTEYMQKGTGTEQYEVLANRIRNAVDQYRAEQAFQTTLSWYQRLCEQSLAGTYLVQDQTFTFVNEKFAEVFGYEQDELIDEDVLIVVSESDRETVRENLRKRLEGERETIRYQFTGKRKDGEPIDIDVHGGAIEFGGEPAILGILSELSE